jgi:hypothetical protein
LYTQTIRRGGQIDNKRGGPATIRRGGKIDSKREGQAENQEGDKQTVRSW